MKTILVILGLMTVFGGVLYAQGKITKSAEGFTLFAGKVKTYYVNRIVWGDDYIDHEEGQPLRNIEVVVWGKDWEYRTTTDYNGDFKIEVEPDSPFRIKASDGNRWSEFADVLKGIPKGTTFNDKTESK